MPEKTKVFPENSAVVNPAEQISLTGLSTQARRLMQLATTTPGKFHQLLALYANDKAIFWSEAEKLAGPIPEKDRLLIELLAELFIPTTGVSIVDIKNGDCALWAS
jgi:hypothetical protein